AEGVLRAADPDARRVDAAPVGAAHLTGRARADVAVRNAGAVHAHRAVVAREPLAEVRAHAAAAALPDRTDDAVAGADARAGLAALALWARDVLAADVDA